MEKKNKKTIIIGIVSLFIVTLLLVGLTYAYYRTRIIGNQSTDPSLSVVSKNLGVSYSDNNSKISATGVEPGFDDTKTFSVENTGGETVTYEVYLENVVNEYTRTQDWTYSITCTDSNGDECDGISERNYPQLSGRIIRTSIASGVTQTYTLTLKYAESTENQSDDMGKKLEGKIQIYSPEYVVDIEGTVANAEAGDYVQINSVKKTSGIVDGRYKLVGVEAGNHTLTVRNKDGVIKGSAQITIEQGATSGVNGTTITTTEASETITINITSITTNLGLYIVPEIDYDWTLPVDPDPWNEAEEGTLLYALRNNQPSGSEETVPGTEASTENEARIVETEDDNGISRIYRGNVENNYVNYSGMCWRVLRVQGDGAIKLVLADENGECNAATYSISNKSAFINNNQEYLLFNESGEKLIYEDSAISKYLTTWMNKEVTNSEGKVIRNKNLDETKLITTNWCNDTSITNEEDDYETIYYGAYARLKEKSTANPTLKCDMIGFDGSEATKFYSNIGILSADEIVFAGAAYGEQENSYLTTNAPSDVGYLTMTPFRYEDYIPFSWGWYGYRFGEGYFDENSNIRPAIALRSDVLATYDSTSEYAPGTHQNPYVID